LADTDKKTEGPACACGKSDLYEEWLKQNEDSKKADASTPTSQAENQMSSSNAAGNGETEPVQAKK
jgi:hypothetical protein